MFRPCSKSGVLFDLQNLRNLSLSEDFETANDHSFSSPQRRHSCAPELYDETRWASRGDPWNFEPPRAPFRADRSVSLTEGPRNALPPPPGFPPLKAPLPALPAPSPRYKTELCRTFSETGTCKYGSKCQFAHGQQELREPNRHPKYKTEYCHKFYLYGECPYGSRCNFIHHPAEHGTPHQQVLRQSLSYTGVPVRRGSPPLPGFPDPASFSRAASVSPPPSTDMLFSPAPLETRSHVSTLKGMDSCSRCCSCRCSRAGTLPQDPFANPILFRTPSSNSLTENECYSSGSESPVFEVSSQVTSTKRLPIFHRLSVSD